jgi:hypothetical protein
MPNPTNETSVMKAKYVILASALIASPLAAQPEQAPPETAAPAAAAEAPAAAEQVGPATAADLVQGAQVRGTDGAVVGTIDAADAEGATVTSGSVRLRLPLNNFQKDGEGLRIGATRAQFEAAAQASTPS